MVNDDTRSKRSSFAHSFDDGEKRFSCLFTDEITRKDRELLVRHHWLNEIIRG